MDTQPESDSSIPHQIYGLASHYRVGIPLKRQKRIFIPIVLFLEVLVCLFIIGLIGYNIYGYIFFNILSHTYPDFDRVPANQLDTYIWFKVIHDQCWFAMLQLGGLFLGILGPISTFFPASRTKFYICTDGLLILYKRNEQAVRWDEVKELYLTNNKASKLVKQDGTTIALPTLLIDKALTTLISDKVTSFLFPEMLTRYERGEILTFGTLKVHQDGISRPGNMLYWSQIGAIALEKQGVSIYYSKLRKNADQEQTPQPFVGRWYTWRASGLSSEAWSNLPIFVALVDAIIEPQSVSLAENSSLTQQPGTVREIAALAKRKAQRKKWVAIVLAVVSTISALSLIIGIPIYFSIQQQQRAERDTRLLLTYFTQRAHQPYSVHVPGEHCGNGKEYWLDDNSANSYTCQNDGLLMTQKDFKYQDGEYFTFVDDVLSTKDDFSSGHYFPHNYHVQVQATIVSGGTGTCASMEVHIQDFQGRQDFDVCADGSWYYSRCDLHCDNNTDVANGHLPQAKSAFLMALDVSDKSITLFVDNTKVTTVQDDTYSSTDQLELAIYGDQNAGEPVSVRFADFSYTPLP